MNMWEFLDQNGLWVVLAIVIIIGAIGSEFGGCL